MLAVGGLVGLLFGAYSQVGEIAQAAVLDEAFLGKLAKRVRPTMVFDSKGVIRYTSGAEVYVEPNIVVTPRRDWTGFEVFLQTKQFLQVAPVVQGLDAALYPVEVARTATNFGWRILLAPHHTFNVLITQPETDYATNTYQFKLEILH